MKRVKTYWLILPLLLINVFITSVSSGWSEEASTLLEVETRSEMTYSINHYFGNIATQLYNNTNYVGYYTFQGTKGQLFRAMASSSELGHWRLGLTFPNGITYYTREGYNYKEPHQDALIERTLGETGTYTVRIYSQEETYNGKDWPAAGHYTIQSNIELTPTEETAYQNNNPTLYYDIETLDTTSSKSNRYSNGYMKKYFCSINKGALIRVNMSSSQIGQWNLRLIRPNGNTFFRDSSGYIYREPKIDALIEILAPETGNYILEAHSVDPIRYNNRDWPSTGSYSLNSNIQWTDEQGVVMEGKPDTTGASAEHQVSLTNPVGGATYKVGDSIPVTATASGVKYVQIYYKNVNDEQDWGQIGSTFVEQANCTANWSTAGKAPGQYRVKIQGLNVPNGQPLAVDEVIINLVADEGGLQPGQAVSLNKIWTVKFNCAVDPASAKDSSNLYVTGAGGQRIVVTIAVAGDGQSLTISPVGGSWEAMMSYTICLTTGLKSANGAALKTPVFYKFTTQKPDGQEPPSTSYTVSIPKTTFNGGTVQLTSNFPASCKHVYYYLLDSQRKEYGIDVSTTSQAWPASFDSSRYPNGEYTLYAAARDANNQLLYSQAVPGIVINCIVTLTFTMDNPVYKDCNPAITPHLSFSAGATSNYDFEFFVDGTGKGKNQLTWDVSGTSPGKHTITLAATDKRNGNTVTSQSQTITVHAVPTVDFSVPALITQGEIVSIIPDIKVEGTDDPRNYETVLYVDGNEIARGKGNAKIEWDSTDYTVGQHQLKLTAIHSKRVRSFTSKEKTVDVKVVEAPTLRLNESAISIKVGGYEYLTPVFEPSSPSPRPDFKWSSTDPRVAYVEESGKVSAVSEGSVYIVVQTIGFSAHCKVTVLPSDPSPVDRRIIMVGNMDALGADNDLQRMQQLVGSCRFNFSDRFKVSKVLIDKTPSDVQSEIKNTFKDADDNDMSYFYYTGHGYHDDPKYGAGLNFHQIPYKYEDLLKDLDKIPGIKVVILDTCFSGEFINLLNKDQYYEDKYNVIAAVGADERETIILNFGDLTASALTYYLTEGCHVSSLFGPIMPADSNNDGGVTVQEAYSYVEKGYEDSFQKKLQDSTSRPRLYSYDDNLNLYLFEYHEIV